MSYDLMVFEKSKAPKSYEDFLNWTSHQTEWSEERDYSSIDGTALKLTAWFIEMIKTFPALNGKYSLPDEEAFVNEDIEKHLTDYSIGSEIIYAAFGWSMVDEANKTALELAKKHDIGLYNPQSGEVLSCDMILCKIRTESSDDKTAAWEQIEKEILTLDAPERGISHRNGAFITIWFEGNGTDNEFVQCLPDYPKQEGFLKKLFKPSGNAGTSISSYTVEAGTGEKIYTKQMDCKEKAIETIKNYYSSRKLPDITNWEDSGLI